MMIRLPIAYLTCIFLFAFSPITQANTCNLIHPATHPKQYRQLLILSNFSTIQSIQEIPTRLHEIARIFAHQGDRRGFFPAIYAPASEQAISSLTTLTPSALKKMTWFFAEYYFNTLYKHLTAQHIPPYWHLYYQSALTCHTPPLLVISYGLLAHLSFDLKGALLKANITDGLLPNYLVHMLINSIPIESRTK